MTLTWQPRGSAAAASEIVVIVFPPPDLAKSSVVPLSCRRSKGCSRSMVRPGLAKANGIPSGEPHDVETNGTESAALRVIIGWVRRAASSPSGRLDVHRSGCSASPSDTCASTTPPRSRAAARTASRSAAASAPGPGPRRVW